MNQNFRRFRVPRNFFSRKMATLPRTLFWTKFWEFLGVCHENRPLFQLGQLKKKLESMVKLNKTLTVERQQLLHKLKSQVSSPPDRSNWKLRFQLSREPYALVLHLFSKWKRKVLCLRFKSIGRKNFNFNGTHTRTLVHLLSQRSYFSSKGKSRLNVSFKEYIHCSCVPKECFDRASCCRVLKKHCASCTVWPGLDLRFRHGFCCFNIESRWVWPELFSVYLFMFISRWEWVRGSFLLTNNSQLSVLGYTV